MTRHAALRRLPPLPDDCVTQEYDSVLCQVWQLSDELISEFQIIKSQVIVQIMTNESSNHELRRVTRRVHRHVRTRGPVSTRFGSGEAGGPVVSPGTKPSQGLAGSSGVWLKKGHPSGARRGLEPRDWNRSLIKLSLLLEYCLSRIWGSTCHVHIFVSD